MKKFNFKTLLLSMVLLIGISQPASAYYLYLYTGDFTSWENDGAGFRVYAGSENHNFDKIADHWYRADVGSNTGTAYIKRGKGDHSADYSGNEFSANISSSSNVYKVTDWGSGEACSSHFDAYAANEGWAGNAWSAGDDNKLTTFNNWEYSRTFSNVTAQSHKLKVTTLPLWTATWGGSNYLASTHPNVVGTPSTDNEGNLTFEPAMGGNVTINFNASTNKISVTCQAPTITFDQEGGSNGTTSQYTYYNEGTSSITIPTKTGYDFAGYYTGDNGTGTQIIDANGVWLESKSNYTDNSSPAKWIVRANHTLYAKWTAKTYTINLYKNDGSEAKSTTSVTFGQQIPSSVTAPTRTGFSFDGYYDSATQGAGTQYYDSNGNRTYTSTWNSDAGKDLYAHWTVSQVYYQVTYGKNVDKGTVTATADGSPYTSGTDALENATIVITATPTTGYRVEGWYNNQSCTGVAIKTETGEGVKTYSFTLTESCSVYAKFVAINYTISYNNLNGVTHDNPSTYTIEDEIVFSNPTSPCTGYTFTGWNPTGIAKGSTGAKSTSAQWQAKTYTVSFNNNGGEGTVPGNVTATYAAAMPKLNDFIAPVKNGYKFLGYYYGETKYYNADGSSACSWNLDPQEGSATLTAKWDQIHVYIEGHFRVRNGENGEWITPGSSASEYASQSKKVEMPLSGNKYVLNTWADVHELIYSGHDLNFYIATWSEHGGWTKLGADISGENFWFNKVKPENMSSTLRVDGKNFWFKQDGDGDWSYPVILTYDPTANTLSYTAEPEQTYSVNFKSGGHGHLNVSDGIHNVGVRSGYNITAYPDAGYKFEKWTSTGDVVIAEASNASTSITVTGAGTVTANFVEMKKIYFKKHSNWTGSEVYVYFYDGDHVYWNSDKSPADGNMDKGPTSANLTGNQMTEIDKVNHIYSFAIPDNWNIGNAVAFVNERQDNANPFYNTSVAGRNDFNKCIPYFISEGTPAYYNRYYDEKDKENKQTAYYSGGYWTSYDEETEYYLRGSFNDWAGPRDEYRFKNTNDPNIKEAIWKSITGSETIKFKVWQTCDCWYGKSGTSYSGDVEMISLVNNGESSYDINYTATKIGSYQFKYNVSSQKLSITYMGDIMVQDFPEEVSVITGRQYKITPTVTLREGMTLDDLEISVTGNSHAQFTQSGTNLIVLGISEGTDNVTVTYRNNKNDYSVAKNLNVNVATGITLQAKTENTETSWTKTDLVHVHFWSTDGDKAQDASMTYNSESGIYSVTIPKIVDGEDNVNFIFWYGENINMLGSDNAKWRQTDNMKTKVEMCYTIGYNSADNQYRIATSEGNLCESGAYQIEVSMKNGNTYLSNIVTLESESKTFSFFAPKDGDNTYKGGTVRLLMDGGVVKTLTGFSQAGVYVADLNGNDITTPELYNGDYYVIAGVSGSELDDNTKMHKFTPRANTAEDYSYYWTVYSGNCTDKNVIAKVANEYNSNLSLTIGADALTQSDGTVAAGNVRFSYEPTTNAFKRAILGASNSNDFLNVYGNNVYADAAATQPLNEDQSLDLSKFTDNSDWVYEKVVYVKVESPESESKVTLKSVFNGQTSHLLGYEIDDQTGEEKKDQPKQLTVLGTGSTPNNTPYQIRISYDFKKNRLISSWEPAGGIYNEDMAINSDVLFIRTEDGDVQQVQVGIKDGGTESYKISSLQHVMFVMEIDGSTDKTSYSQYWISLPFDCQISDIFGVEGYITLDENRIAQKGTWGIMRYRGDIRAQKGWFKETDGFWEWMYEDEIMNAGEGYVLFFERESIKDWPTIKDKGGNTKALKRLYFPSKDAGFVMSNTVDAAHSQFTCEPMRCNIKTPEDREAYDSNWRVIGPKSYNNITAQTIQTDNPYGTQTQFPNFLYTYDTSKEKGQKYVAYDGRTYNYQSFHAYMVQYEGTITWVPYTQTTTPATVAAHYVEDSNFKGGTLTIELMQNNEQLDRAFVKLDEKGTVGYDFSQDLTKITENCAQIASVSEDVLYAGNTLPLDIEMVPLNVKVVANGTYDIALEQSLEGLEVRLYDAFEQTTTPLDLMSATVTLDKGEYKDRFFLQFVQKSPLTPTNFNGTIEQFNLPTDKTQKLLINDNIYLINAGRIYNTSGTQVK